MDNYCLGKYLKKFIVANNISKKDLSRMFGVTVNSIESWIKEEKKPETDKICQLALFLGISIDELLDGKASTIEKEIMTYDEYKEKRKKHQIFELSKLPQKSAYNIVKDYLANYKLFLEEMELYLNKCLDIDNLYENFKSKWNKLSLELFSKSNIIFVKGNGQFLNNDNNKLNIRKIANLIKIECELNEEILKNNDTILIKRVKDENGNDTIFYEFKEDNNDEFAYICNAFKIMIKACLDYNSSDFVELLKNIICCNTEIENVLISRNDLTDLLIEYISFVDDLQLECLLVTIIMISTEMEKAFLWNNLMKFSLKVVKGEETIGNYFDTICSKVKTEVLFNFYLRNENTISQYISMKDFCIALHNHDEYVNIYL